jgi:hypothetical protein
MRNGENAEAWQAYFFASLKSTGDSCEYSVNSSSCVGLSQTALFRYCGDQFVLVHRHFLSLSADAIYANGLGAVYSNRLTNQACQHEKTPENRG